MFLLKPSVSNVIQSHDKGEKDSKMTPKLHLCGVKLSVLIPAAESVSALAAPSPSASAVSAWSC